MGMEWDISRAGDQLSRVDMKIWRIKERIRAIIADVPHKLGKKRIKDLAAYVTRRINTRCFMGLLNNVAPRVKFTGVKHDFNAEFGLAFGDYVGAKQLY